MNVASIDISNWTGELSADQIACLKQHDIRYVIVRGSLEHGKRRTEIARQQMDALIAAGIEIGVYVWCYFASWDAEQTIRDTIALIENRPCRYLFLDCEETEDITTPQQHVVWLTRAIAEIRRHDRLPAIYTGAWWWNDPRYMAGTRAVGSVELWTALYDGNPDPTVWQPYGGWTHLLGKQYAGSGQQSLCGLSCDLNTFTDAVLTPAPPPPPPPPTPDPEPGVTIEAVKLGLIDKVIHGEWAALRDDTIKLAGVP